MPNSCCEISPDSSALAEDVGEHRASPGTAGFVRILRAKGVLPLSLASVVARLPIGMASIAVIFYIHQEFGSFAAAGVVTAAFSVGMSATATTLARLVDSRGDGLLLPASLISSLLLASIVLLGQEGAPLWSLAAFAALSGAFLPPLGGVVRHRLPDLVARKDTPTIFALDSIMLELIFVLGPLLAGLLAATVGPMWAVLAAALAGPLGTVLFVRSLPPRHPDPDPPARPRGGALSSPAIRVLVLGCLPVGAAFGCLEIALPAFGASQGAAALGGPLSAALAVGSAIGGIIYGTHPRAFGSPERAIIVLGASEAILALPLLIGPPFAVMLCLVVLAGLPSAPLLSARSEIVRGTLPRGTGTEAFTWLTVSLTIGYSAGSALAGLAVQSGWRFGILLAAILPLFNLVLVTARRDELRPAD